MKIVLNTIMLGAMTVAFTITLPGVSIAEETFLNEAIPISKASKAKANSPGLGDQTSSYFRDYLSDPRRSGSLAGSIIGGALSAHPAGPILGSLVGFLVGKQSMFNEDKAREMNAGWLYAKRDIVPQTGQAMPTMSLANVQSITFETPGSLEVNQVASPRPSVMGFSREQIAAMCSGKVSVDPRLSALCFYSHGS